jgi:bacterioferritin-associated ferredoxin
MVVTKRFVCLCEDVTVDELRAAIRRGFTDIEEVKRITGISTGPCQGKQCLHTFRRLLAEETGRAIEEIPLTTLRPPVMPVPFGQMAGSTNEKEGA